MVGLKCDPQIASLPAGNFYKVFLTLTTCFSLLVSSCGGFPGGSDGKESACNAGDLSLIPGLGRYLEEGMATHSRVLVWRIPWIEEPGGLQSMGSQRVGHD